MAGKDSFGSQWVVLAFVAITASSASTWYSRASHESPPPLAILQKPAPEAHATDNSSTIVPSPILRPLALLANAIGAEPLFVLKMPGKPVLSPSFRAAPSAGTCPNKTLANSMLLDSEQDVCGVISAMRVKVGTLKVRMLIATLPDWVDSSLQWTFDPMLDAIQMSAAQMGYVLTGFDMADSDPDPETSQLKGSVWPFPRTHELTPGSLLFRRATAGVHSAALAAALDLALLWDLPGDVSGSAGSTRRSTGALGILGPTFSGSTFSGLRGLKDAAERHGLAKDCALSFDVVTGSASSTQNPTLFASLGLASFRSTTRSDAEALSAMVRHLGNSKPGWQCGAHMALLVESNATWGRSVVDSLRKPAAATTPNNGSFCDQCLSDPSGSSTPSDELHPCATVVLFPLHISRLRSASPTTAQAEKLPSKSAVILDLSDKLQPVDRIPPETPQLTSATFEIMVSGMFRAIKDRQVTAIGILATDKRDHLYLAEEITRHRPNVLAFTLESSLVYLHPDVADFVRGTLVASTYSLGANLAPDPPVAGPAIAAAIRFFDGARSLQRARGVDAASGTTDRLRRPGGAQRPDLGGNHRFTLPQRSSKWDVFAAGLDQCGGA